MRAFYFYLYLQIKIKMVREMNLPADCHLGQTWQNSEADPGPRVTLMFWKLFWQMAQGRCVLCQSCFATLYQECFRDSCRGHGGSSLRGGEEGVGYRHRQKKKCSFAERT